MLVGVERAAVLASTGPVPAKVSLRVEDGAQAPPAAVQSAPAAAGASPANAVIDAWFTIVFFPPPPSMPVAVASDFVEVFASDTPAKSTDTVLPLALLRAEALIAARLLISSSPPPACMPVAPACAGALASPLSLPARAT